MRQSKIGWIPSAQEQAALATMTVLCWPQQLEFKHFPLEKGLSWDLGMVPLAQSLTSFGQVCAADFSLYLVRGGQNSLEKPPHSADPEAVPQMVPKQHFN